MEERQYTLPRPAEQWPEDYDYEGHNFAMPREDMRQIQAYYLAITPVANLPTLQNKVFPFEMELRLVSDFTEGRLLRDLFE